MSAPKPLIGVTTSRNRGRLMWWFNRFALWRAGARGVRLQPRRPVDVDRLQGLVLGGGDDIDAELYGPVLQPSIRIDPDRDALEVKLLGLAAARRLPVLGICRGAQMINVFLGGTLHQDAYAVYAGARRMRTPLPRKTVRLIAGSRLQAIVDKAHDRVNVLHRQSVDRLGRGLRVAARDEHGMVQAVERPAYPFMLGVQWHPEFMVFDSGQQRLYRALVAAAREGMAAAARRPRSDSESLEPATTDRQPAPEETAPCSPGS